MQPEGQIMPILSPGFKYGGIIAICLSIVFTLPAGCIFQNKIIFISKDEYYEKATGFIFCFYIFCVMRQ
jgi:hypothetical protein